MSSTHQSLFLLLLADLAPQEKTLDRRLDEKPTEEEDVKYEVGVDVDGEVHVELEHDEGHEAMGEPEVGERRAGDLRQEGRGRVLPKGLHHRGALQDGDHLLLEADGDELVEEGDVVPRVVPVPHGEEGEGADLARVLVVEEAQPLVHVVQHPGVGVDVERLDHVVETGDGLESGEGS